MKLAFTEPLSAFHSNNALPQLAPADPLSAYSRPNAQTLQFTSVSEADPISSALAFFRLPSRELLTCSSFFLFFHYVSCSFGSFFFFRLVPFASSPYVCSTTSLP